MAKTATKRFSNVRYWRYVFTPILFVIAAISLYIVFTSDVAMSAPYNALRASYQRNTQGLVSSGVNWGRK